MEFVIFIILFFGGILTGLYASLVGGGGLVTFPLLILTGLPTHIAIATNRLGAVILELSSIVNFYKEKTMNLRLGIFLGVFAGLGSIIGSFIVIKITPKFLNLIIAILFLLIFIVLLNKDKLGLKEKKLKNKNPLLISLFSFLLGIYGGFFGTGFGTFIMFLLVLYGFTFIKSAATARIIGFIMSLTAAIVFALNGLIVYSYALSIGFGTIIGSWYGVKIGIKKGNNYIRTLFFVLIILTVVKLILDFFDIKLLF